MQIPRICVGVEARGFIFGPSIALAIGAKFVPLRKPKKLPGEFSTTILLGCFPTYLLDSAFFVQVYLLTLLTCSIIISTTCMHVCQEFSRMVTEFVLFLSQFCENINNLFRLLQFMVDGYLTCEL